MKSIRRTKYTYGRQIPEIEPEEIHPEASQGQFQQSEEAAGCGVQDDGRQKEVIGSSQLPLLTRGQERHVFRSTVGNEGGRKKLTPDMPRQSQAAEINHYAALGLERRCSVEQIRNAYRLLAKQYHPDLNPNSPPALARIQEINAAYETLSDPGRRFVYDQELAAPLKTLPSRSVTKVQRNIAQDLLLCLEEFLRGTTREVHVNDPANPNGPESYEVIVPPDTAPGTRFRLPRGEPFAGGFIQLRVRPLPGFRFKVRGSDLRCDLKIKPQRAAQGGIEMIPGVTGALVRVEIPRGVGRLEVLRISGEGLPKPRGGRGDLLVRVNYSVGVRISRPSGH